MDAIIGVSFVPSTGATYTPPGDTQDMPKSPASPVWSRIQEAVKASGRVETQEGVARMLGIRQPSVSEWARGVTRPTTKHLEAIGMKTGFAIEYLRTGRGPRRVQPTPADDELLQELMALWSHLTANSRLSVLQHAKLVRTIQDTADPARIKEVHDELREANHRFREKDTVPVRR